MLSQANRSTTYALYACLGSDNARSLQRATAILDRMELPAAEFLTNLLLREIPVFRRSRRQRAWLSLLTIALFVLAHGRFVLGWQVQDGVSLLLLPGLLVMRLLLMRCVAHRTMQRRLRNILFLLQANPPVRQAGVFVDVMRYGECEASCLAQAILVQILPRLQDEDLLTQDQHAALCRALRGTNSNLILAILAAFKHAGDPRSLGAVRRMVSCPEWLADAPRIQSTAADCLTALQERARRQAMAQTSLRASTTTYADYQLLLRPAHAHRIQNAMLLVRASTVQPQCMRTGEKEEDKETNRLCKHPNLGNTVRAMSLKPCPPTLSDTTLQPSLNSARRPNKK